jgi:hypothetical protein
VTTSTHVPQVIDALIALFKSALPELDSKGGIFDGPPTTNLPADVALVAFNPGTVARPQVAAVKSRQDLSEYIPGGTREEMEIFCQISAHEGDVDISIPRSRCLTYFNELSTALAADRSLGGVVPLPGKATVSSVDWYLEQGGEDFFGCSATVVFTITCAVEFM